MTTIETVTAQQLQQLRTEAEQAGDSKQVEQCDLATRYLTYSPAIGPGSLPSNGAGEKALAGCVSAINAAEAMQ